MDIIFKYKISIISNCNRNINEILMNIYYPQFDNDNNYNNNEDLIYLYNNNKNTINNIKYRKCNTDNYTYLYKTNPIISYLNNNNIKFGIIRRIEGEKITINEVYVEKISLKIYKIINIENIINIEILIENINIFNNIYHSDCFYFFITDFTKYNSLNIHY